MNKSCVRLLPLALALAVGQTALHAQFEVAGRKVQIHGFISQGFGYSNQNNYLTMKTSEGSFAMTDGGLNISSPITDKFRIGAQVYSRNVGDLGNGHVDLDWAFGDYRIKDWFGVRAGKIKTSLGLYTDTQDQAFLHTWALLPQSMYPTDLRANTIAHSGADIYGDIAMRKAGSLSYTGYVGNRPNDKRGGYVYGIRDGGVDLTSDITGWVTGGDVRWNTPVNGLMVGQSFFRTTMDFDAKTRAVPGNPIPGGIRYHYSEPKDHTYATYGEYSRGNLRLNAEYRQQLINYALKGVPATNPSFDTRSWFASAAYRVQKRLELGTYHTRYVYQWNQPHDRDDNHIYDTAVTARVDVLPSWYVKAEGHFMDGYGSVYSVRGFYQSTNPGGLKPRTNLLVIRTGFNF